MEHRLTLTQAGRTLGLLHSWPEQDWGIVNADPDRVEDFAAFYREHVDDFADWAVEFHLGELVLESVNADRRSNRVTERSATPRPGAYGSAPRSLDESRPDG